MTTADERLNWLVIDDFSPGIYASAGTKHPLGAATTDTYRCTANVDGALVPGPRATNKVGLNVPPETTMTDVATEDYKYWIVGMHANPAFVYGGVGNPTPGVDQNNTELYFGVEWYTSTHNYRRMYRYRRNFASPGLRWQTCKTWSELASVQSTTRPNRAWMASTMSNPSTPTVAGAPVTACSFNNDDTDEAVVFPDPTVPSVNGNSAIPSPASPWRTNLMVAHQGRLVFAPLNLYGDGDNQVVATANALYWTTFNDHSTLDSNLGGLYTSAVTGYENPTGFVDAASLSQEELLLLKSNGGAVLIRGDIVDPAILPLPMVMSPGLSLCQGVVTPVGYAYVVDSSGLWLWSGGDTSQFVSPQMDPDFWRPVTDYATGEDATGSYYWHPSKMSLWHEWIVLPGSYFYDWSRNAFWRYAQRDLFFTATDPKQRWLYASRARFDNEDLSMFWEFDRTLGARTYKWTSHPIPASIYRKAQVRRLVIVASGQGKVRVTVQGSDTGGQTHTVDVNSTMPSAHNLSIGVTGHHIQVVIESAALGCSFDNGVEADNDAPTVYEIRLGTVERMQIAGTGE